MKKKYQCTIDNFSIYLVVVFCIYTFYLIVWKILLQASTERKRHEELILKIIRHLEKFQDQFTGCANASFIYPGVSETDKGDLNEHELTECLRFLNRSAAELISVIHNIHDILHGLKDRTLHMGIKHCRRKVKEHKGAGSQIAGV